MDIFKLNTTLKKIFTKTYDKPDVFYYLDENIITTKREQFLTALESFKNKFKKTLMVI